MKIAINLTRDNVGGITSSNLNFVNYLYKLDYEFIGLELTSRIYMKGPALFRHFDPEVFDHHIINIHHLPLMDVLKCSNTLKDAENTYKEPIKIIREILRTLVRMCVDQWYLLSALAYIYSRQKENIPVILWYSGVLSKKRSLSRQIKETFYIDESGSEKFYTDNFSF